MQLSTIDLYRVKSALHDYKKRLARTLPAEVSLPKEIAALMVRIDQELNERIDSERGHDTVAVR